MNNFCKQIQYNVASVFLDILQNKYRKPYQGLPLKVKFNKYPNNNTGKLQFTEKTIRSINIS